MANFNFTKDIRLLGRDWPVALRPHTAVSEHQKLHQGNDRRVMTWERTVEYISRDRNQAQEPQCPNYHKSSTSQSQNNQLSHNIPSKFPDHDVLQFWTICLRLTLADPKPASKPPRPLLSSISTVVGSLHPDSTSVLPPTPSPIELIALSRFQTPIASSALLDIEKERKPTPGQPWELLWVMHIEWKNGVAERRGVGQVLTKGALEGAVGKVEVKLVVLG
ncbi:hypothetical protein VF21_03475 [Pseudogymnoascus sp. 05NY08]|nr:hypothetical protein VF21_03475 [Pseudogymnoascus sp. 05NY08]